MVLDIETALDRDAVARSGRGGPAAFARSWLHRVVAVSTLSWTYAASECAFVDFELETQLALDPGQERALLEAIEARLERLGSEGTLITFNGAAHDLPTLQRRRLSHWMFEPSLLRAWLDDSISSHDDLLKLLSQPGEQRWPSLVDVCACLDLPCHYGPRGRGSSRLNPFLVKGQIDVAATFLVHCTREAHSAGSSAPLVKGWTALADHLLKVAPTQPHLTQFATTPRALEARRHAQSLTS